MYAINYHAANYQASEGRTVDAKPNAVGYFRSKLAHRPFAMLDSLALGMTSYPFSNKWHGFDVWLPRAGYWLSWASLFGLLLFTRSDSGRLLLVVLITSLLPFAFTWTLWPDRRFTEHAYPSFLIASVFAFWQVAMFVVLARWREARTWCHSRAMLARGLVLATALVMASWLVVRELPVLVAREGLSDDGVATVRAGGRDSWFFAEGWSAPISVGNVVKRVSVGRRSVVRLPLGRAEDYEIHIRLDPFPRPLPNDAGPYPSVWLLANGHLISRLDLTWNPERVGGYSVRLPSSVLRDGSNDLILVPAEGEDGTERGDSPAGQHRSPAFAILVPADSRCAAVPSEPVGSRGGSGGAAQNSPQAPAGCPY